jgi:hypothetical protein
LTRRPKLDITNHWKFGYKKDPVAKPPTKEKTAEEMKTHFFSLFDLKIRNITISVQTENSKAPNIP